MMPYRKIHIVGGPGSGKSFISAKLSRLYGLPAFDLDDLFWDRYADRYGIKASPEERDHALTRILDGSAWIIEGVYYGWLSRSFAEAERIIILTPSVTTRDWRICKRFLLRKMGLVPRKKKESLGDLWELLTWNHRYDGGQLRDARVAISHLQDKIVECQTFHEVVRALDT
jgi:adenylate kinase family enzyme